MKNESCRGWLVLAIAFGLALRAEAQPPASDVGKTIAAQNKYEERRGLPGFEWIEPIYPDCPKARFKWKNDECGGVKKHPRDPEDVLGDYWRRSVWAYTPQFAERFKAVDKSAVRSDLPRHVQAIELRVVWEHQERYRYQCEIGLFIENALMDFIKLPSGMLGARFSAAGMLPPGAERPPPSKAAWSGFDHEAFALYNETSFSLVSYDSKKVDPVRFHSGWLQKFHRDVFEGHGYLHFRDMCDGVYPHPHYRHEIWLPAQRTAGAPVEFRRYGKGDYLVLPLPAKIIERAAPYWRRAFAINVCLDDADRTFPPGGFMSHVRACELLRREPIDSLKTPLEFFNEQARLDQRRKSR